MQGGWSEARRNWASGSPAAICDSLDSSVPIFVFYLANISTTVEIHFVPPLSQCDIHRRIVRGIVINQQVRRYRLIFFNKKSFSYTIVPFVLILFSSLPPRYFYKFIYTFRNDHIINFALLLLFFLLITHSLLSFWKFERVIINGEFWPHDDHRCIADIPKISSK